MLAVVSTYFQSFPEIRMILYALILIIIMIFRPQGLLGSKEISLSVFNRASKFLHLGREKNKNAIVSGREADQVVWWIDCGVKS